MKEHLERWAKLEPERCRLKGHFIQFKFGNAWSNSIYRIEDFDEIDFATVQAAVQEAIQSRLWEWQVAGFFYYGELMFNAVVNTDCHSEHPDDSVETGKDHTAAAALLSAYLKALENL